MPLPDVLAGTLRRLHRSGRGRVARNLCRTGSSNDGRAFRLALLVRPDRPLELELDFFLVLIALVLDRELGALGNPKPFTRDLDSERLILLQGVGEPTQLRHHLLGRVHAFEISRRFRHADTPSYGSIAAAEGAADRPSPSPLHSQRLRFPLG